MKRWLAWGALAVLVAAAALVALAAYLVDAPAVQAEFQRRVAAALGGQVSWEAFEVGFLPPNGKLRKLRVEIPDKLAADADEVQANLRLWPLFRGRVEVASVSLKKPMVRILMGGGKGDDAPLDAVALYRAAMEPAARALREFAPDMTFRLSDAAVDAAPLELRALNASLDTGAEGFELDVSASSNFWKRLRVKGRVAYADLAARADFELDLGALAAKGELQVPPGKPPELTAELDRVEVAEAIALARKFANLDVLESVDGRVSAKVHAHLSPAWRLQVDVTRSDAAVKLAALPWKVSATGAHVTITQEHVRIIDGRGAVGDSTFTGARVNVDLRQQRISEASAQATLQLEPWFAWLKEKLPLEMIDSLSGSAAVTLNRLALRFDRPAEVDFDALVAPRKVSAALKMLAAPVSVTGGTARVGRDKVTLDKVAVAMLDASALVSGNVGFKGPDINLAIAEGTAGEKVVRWALERGQVPTRFEPRTPLRFSAQRLTPNEADARIAFDGGPEVSLTLAWKPELLELRRLAIKDARSDAVFGATLAGERVQASFSGTLDGRSLTAMLRQTIAVGAGVAKGKLQLAVDRSRPAESTAQGELLVEALDLSWLAGRKALVQRADIVADGASLRITDAQVSLDEQPIRLRGDIRRTAQGPVVDARLESPGVDLERLVPQPDPARKKAGPTKVWPLPVSGKIEVRSGFVQYQRYRIEPFDGTLSLEREKARLEVKEARMCGVSFPLEMEAVPENVSLAVHIRMKDQPLENVVPCLTGDAVQLTGTADLQAELRTHGHRPNLVRNLTGTAQAELRDGRVKRFALLGNILSLRNITGVERLKEDGFPYRGITARGRFEAGEFRIEEAFFDSDALRLAAHGKVDLLGAGTQLTVLVGLLTSVDRISGAIPILGDIFGGSMTALPLSVSGDIRDPSIVPLGPRAVTDRLLGIFERTLKLPGKLVPAETKPTP